MSNALIMLAAGLSARFGEDKLLAKLRGRPVAAYAAELWKNRADIARIAIVPSGNSERRAIFEAEGWTVLDNADPSRGQASSLSIGIQAAQQTSCENVVIGLADMPFVREAHLNNLMAALENADAVMSLAADTLLPPAVFSSVAFERLLALKGDRGARRVFEAMERTANVAINPLDARDIDTPETLMALNFEEADHA